MTTTTYTVPANPPDAESAALELIARLPPLVGAEHFTRRLRDYCAALRVEGVFAGLSWRDAKQVAAAIVSDVMHRDDPAAALRRRARHVLAGDAGEWGWCARGGAARALNIAAAVLGICEPVRQPASFRADSPLSADEPETR